MFQQSAKNSQNRQTFEQASNRTEPLRSVVTNGTEPEPNSNGPFPSLTTAVALLVRHRPMHEVPTKNSLGLSGATTCVV